MLVPNFNFSPGLIDYELLTVLLGLINTVTTDDRYLSNTHMDNIPSTPPPSFSSSHSTSPLCITHWCTSHTLHPSPYASLDSPRLQNKHPLL
ncbi:hypothetical protein CVT24_009884 [Panaeolus cyanescens]|uniref:Uncharacterized protein n=1 Tax=Panaeolus cyanescens TaxID=181874 RepID=A0A409X779_9AGAR|nr:hypothetical protein CVT24_009884 [Panaeolus cyanescens]